MTDERKKILGHMLACGTQIMWGATFVSTKVLVGVFAPVEVLTIRAILAFITLSVCFPHRVRLREKRQELYFCGAALWGIVLYFMLENTALTLTYASNVGIIVACAPFFVAVMVSLFYKNERPGRNFYLGFVVALLGVGIISFNGSSSLHLNPAGDLLAFCAMICWGLYSVSLKKISEWNYPTAAVTRRIYGYAILLLIPIIGVQELGMEVPIWQKAAALVEPRLLLNFLFLGVGASALGFFFWNLSTKWIGAVKTSVYIYLSPLITVLLSVVVLHERMTGMTVLGGALIIAGLLVSQKQGQRAGEAEAQM